MKKEGAQGVQGLAPQDFLGQIGAKKGGRTDIYLSMKKFDGAAVTCRPMSHWFERPLCSRHCDV